MNRIALLTDFGVVDGYVGVMKGAIACIAPGVMCIDISHDIAPQDLWGGRFCLMNAAPYFPTETVFLGVVDPGVGGDRQGIAVRFKQGYFVGPDNGLVSGLLEKFEAIAAVSLNNSQYWRTSDRERISQTFHGRDIFAPVAAHLAQGVPLAKLGSPLNLDELITLPLPSYVHRADQIEGTIQHIDHFGNLITTIPAQLCANIQGYVLWGDRQIPLVTTYSQVPSKTLCALIGSHGWLEISLNQGNASQKLAAKRHDPIIFIQQK